MRLYSYMDWTLIEFESSLIHTQSKFSLALIFKFEICLTELKLRFSELFRAELELIGLH